MGYWISQIWLFRLGFWVGFFSFIIVCVPSMAALEDLNIEGTVHIDGKEALGRIDDDFICATMDWWPPEKCDYGTCSWGQASFLNLDLSSKVLLNAVTAFSPLKIRLGGTLQDKVIYDTPDNKLPCKSFVKNASEMFGFTDGCLPMNRWDELNSFFEKSGAKVIFGLNALTGRSVNPGGTSTGPWDYANTESLIRYTVENKYSVHGWELGNELNANGIGTRVSADQYAADTIALYNIVQNIYKGKEEKPLILAPGGFFDLKWFEEYIDLANNSLNVVTHHIYNLGPGVDENLVEKILDPSYLDGEANTFRSLHDILRNSTTTAWVGEAGGAYNSGRNNVTNAFVFSFWYLDQLGMSSTYDTKTYCRQSLVGGNYGLLNTASYIPNPDYYSALLWHRLMGRKVLSTSFSASNKIRAYAHCARKSKGITVLLINLDGKTTVQANIDSNNTLKSHHKHNSYHSFHKSKLNHMPHASMNATMARAEYHLTAKNGNLQSQSMMLNGNILSVDSSGKIPTMDPIYVDPSRPVVVGPYSIVFAHIPYIVPPACC